MPFPGPGAEPSGLFGLALAVIIGVFVIMVGKSIAEWAANQSSPVQNRSASVVSKRENVWSGGGEHAHTSTTYYVTFQFPDGNRLELRLPGHTFGLIAEGDRGMLNYQGTQFNSFTRELASASDQSQV